MFSSQCTLKWAMTHSSINSHISFLLNNSLKLHSKTFFSIKCIFWTKVKIIRHCLNIRDNTIFKHIVTSDPYLGTSLPLLRVKIILRLCVLYIIPLFAFYLCLYKNVPFPCSENEISLFCLMGGSKVWISTMAIYANSKKNCTSCGANGFCAFNKYFLVCIKTFIAVDKSSLISA